MKTRKGALWAALSFFLFLGVGAGFASLPEGPSFPAPVPSGSPDFDGEWIEYVASWNGIPLASATVRASPVFVEGEKFHEVKISAETWSYLDLIWKMRDTVEALFEAETIQPRRFILRQRENRKRVDTSATFDTEAQKWLVQRQKGKKVQDYEFAAPRLFDPVSATYWARTQDLKTGDSLPLHVFGGKNLYHLDLHVVGRERVVVKAGEFEAYKIISKISNLNGDGLAEKVREASIWISADESRMPVRIDTRVAIGSVSIQMVRKGGGGTL